jgi:Tol biopolymer transport system component
MLHRYLICFFFLIGLFYSPDLYSQAQGINTDFGKNRVQYKDFQWFYYRSPYFDTYYYKNGKELGATVGKLAEQNLKEIENILDYKLEGRIKILAYNKLSDLKQTNLGLNTQASGNTGGYTEIVGNKIFVYFDGNTANLRKQIRAGIAQILISEMLFGGNIQEMVSNSTLLTVPDWFMPGLISYIAEEWSIELDNRLKDGIISGRYKKFNRLVNEDSRVAGHSLWKYVIDNHGLASVSNIIYMTRVNKNAESGFIYILGLNFKELSPQWFQYYQAQYAKIDDGKNLPPDDARFSHKKKKRTRKFDYDQFKVSPDGKSYTYVVNKQGRFSVYVYNAQTEKTKRVFRAGIKTPALISENSEPVIAWHPNGILLAVAYEKKSNALIQVLNTKSKKPKKDGFEVKMYKYEKILDFDYSSDGRKWVLSAVTNGQSDLYVFDVLSRRDERITNDWYDDLNPRFVQLSTKIIFSSNRNEDSLKKARFMQLPQFNNYDLYIYEYAIKDPELTRVTNTPFINEIKPVEYDSSRVAFLNDESGISNRQILVFDSVVAYQYDTTIYWYDTTISVYRDTFTTYTNTSYKRNIIDHDVSKRSGRLSEIISAKNQSQLFLGKRSVTDTVDIIKTPYRQKKEKNLELAWKLMLEKHRLDSIAREDSIKFAKKLLNPDENDSTLIVPDSVIEVKEDAYYFQTDFPSKPVDSAQQSGSGDSGTKKDEFAKEKAPVLDDYFTKSSPSPYVPIFSTNYVIAQLDNNSLFNSYQTFTGGGPIYYNSNINALIKIGTADLMEDYRFTGGFRLSGNFTIPEYFLSFENLKRRLDKELIFYKTTKNYSFEGLENVILKGNIYEFRTVLKWPFNEQAALKASISLRREDYSFLSTEPATLQAPGGYTNDIGYKLEYIFDNTIAKGLNLFNGTRYKFYIEQFKTIDVKDASMMNMGFDFRHYEKLSRQIIFAGRIAGSTSVGNQKVMYYLGGVDSWIIPRFNDNIQIDQNRSYKYHALATNMRGFIQNIRNGNNFAVINTEIRVPVFAYLLNRPIKSDFVKNFQLVPFGDVGAAWVGSDPFSEENRFNKITIEQPPITVRVIETKFPIVGGFGGGLRTRILGYFVRFDTAWGVENSRVAKKPVYYFSLNLDF